MSEDPAQDQDGELLRLAAKGDLAAFAKFYDRHAGLMFSVAMRILNDAGEAEDVLQEAFTQIWEKASLFDPRLGKASSWAAVLARNKAIDRVRASQRRLKLAVDAGINEVELAPPAETVNGQIYGQEKAALVHAALGGLPAEQRRAIELAYFSGLTQTEISDHLQEPLGTIKARIRRGLLQLRDKLEGLL